MLLAALFVVLFSLVFCLLVAGLLHLLPRVGGEAWSRWLSEAPGLDVAVFALTVLPQLVGLAAGVARDAGFLGTILLILAAVVGQGLALFAWMRLHELAHKEAMRGPRLKRSMNRAVGPVANGFAVWWTALAVPVFAIVRLAEIVVYPPLVKIIHLPAYDTKGYINVSRQKHEHLVGADRIWCLYCDWMTGVWSLGTEILRNIESFWCPLRYGNAAKCENCVQEFPDIDGGWAPADSGMAGAVAAAEKHYPGPPDENGKPFNSWFGHPKRQALAQLTVGGAEVAGLEDAAATPRGGGGA
ncbi:hypothetical protein [Phycisphaera mikurensis]|uniref:Uncharacterized protein n=1 Tax=Phycisphaera mikurensis (strain NBRC 102666 / KCTC 22515 / FYK2301M01) TaxID=1142394 RepID=I0IEZ4_PHYMF|nr:hypothetical protein [Phycisphaera mikurensis]MBB6441626.1 hypothetical protein [Phycisphaera mikurensis]BAM03832.1 hypothetical protein PSMK_16730 [Phycisphaera mikurensis NBRC 102666]